MTKTQTLFGIVDRRTGELMTNSTTKRPHLYTTAGEADEYCASCERVVEIQVTYEWNQ